MNDNKISIAIVTPGIDIKTAILTALRLAEYEPNPVTYAATVQSAYELLSLANARRERLDALFLDNVVYQALTLVEVINTSDAYQNTVVVALSPSGSVHYRLRDGKWSKTMSLFGITPENMQRVLQK